MVEQEPAGPMEGNAFPMMFVFPVIPQQEGEISLPPADVRPDLPPIVPTGAETVAASYNIDSGVPIRTPLPGSIPLQPAIDPYLLALSAAAQPSTAVHLPDTSPIHDTGATCDETAQCSANAAAQRCCRHRTTEQS